MPLRVQIRRSILFALASVISTIVVAKEPAARPNIVVVLIDNQGYFELGCKGHPNLRTPNIDDFARESVDFCNFHAENFCSPSRAALLTGRQPMRYGVYDTVGGVSLLSAEETTIAEILQEGGYQTGIFGKWHLGMSYPFHPRHRGFDEVFVHGGGGIGQLEDYAENRHLNAHYEHNGKWVSSDGFSTDVLFDEATRFIKSCGDRPFFCYIPTPAVHFPVQSEPNALERIKQRGVTPTVTSLALMSMIENLDERFGQFLDDLNDMELADNTLVVFMTDQGVGDRGSPTPVWPQGKDRQDLGNASEGKHRVFCMIRKPGLTVAREHRALACIRDICPTILELCGSEQPDNIDGRSLVPLLSGDDDWPDERTIVMQCPRNRVPTKWRHAAVKQGDWRLVDGGRLYDIGNDTRMEHDLAALHPDVVERLNASYDSFWESLPPEDELVNRHILGAEECPATELCAMDWRRGDAPWGSGAIRDIPGRQGAWAVHVARKGTYRLALRRTREETPRALEASSARVEIGPRTAVTQMDPQAAVAEVELELEPGDFELQTWLHSPDDPETTWGANFVYVQYLDSSK